MGLFSPNYSTFPRYGIAPDRFLARSHLVEVTRTPDDLLDGSIWDKLSKDVWSKFMLNQQTETVYRNKMMLWRYLYVYIKVCILILIQIKTVDLSDRLCNYFNFIVIV